MTEPQGGSDPGLFTTRAVRDGDDWVINGEKWFSSNARYASFFIVMAVTNPEARTRQKMSLFIVPAETPGIQIVRNVGVGGNPQDTDRTAMCATPTCGFRPTTSSAAKVRHSPSPRPGWAAVGYITRCVQQRWRAGHST